MIWNELDYGLQVKVIDRIVELLKDEEDGDMQDGLIAAIHELEVWSNTPCQTVGEDGLPEYVAVAVEQDPFSRDGYTR
jgi:hypothetical protein